ncbi:hypothetical protein C7B82_15745 [Stenomitos frigidus ULC18]|uniref:DUF1997 domain-containing protein n=2 Tax=Stenomitos TaxID=1844270 RepID=A0A2T1E5E3_9CYAN|nr:hypothetical protein C7B82_15745 [Stenomitos frigidus ULC18]
MQSHSTESQSTELPEGLLHTASVIPDMNYLMTEDSDQNLLEPTQFRSHFVDCMEMSADLPTVAAYLDAHSVWFHNCAQPMVVEPLGDNGYALVIGRFGSYGYQIEPKIGLHLLPQDHGVYRIETIAIPGYVMPGYDVDFRAAMTLVEAGAESASSLLDRPGTPSAKTTRVEWQLDLTVSIQFPRFIHALPKSLVQNTGDRLLRQIVRQVSNRLTRKVLEDFHQTHGLPLPKPAKRWFFQKSESVLDEPLGDEPTV